MFANVNATILMFSRGEFSNPANISFSGIYDSVIPKEKNNDFYLKELNFAVCLSMIFDDRLTWLTRSNENYLQLEHPYACVVRLTHVLTGNGVNLGEFELTVDPKNLKRYREQSFYEYNRVFCRENIILPFGLGEYVLRLVIAPKNTDPDGGWQTQALHSLLVGATV